MTRMAGVDDKITMVETIHIKTTEKLTSVFQNGHNTTAAQCGCGFGSAASTAASLEGSGGIRPSREYQLPPQIWQTERGLVAEKA